MIVYNEHSTPLSISLTRKKKRKRNNNNNNNKKSSGLTYLSSWAWWRGRGKWAARLTSPGSWRPAAWPRLDLLHGTCAHTQAGRGDGAGGRGGCKITAYLSRQAVRRPITDLISRSSGPVESLPFMRRQHSFSNIMGRLSFFLLLSDAHYSHDSYYFFLFCNFCVNIHFIFL